MSLPLPGAARLRALRRMKAFSAALLVLAAVVFALCRALTDGHGGWGYLQAAAEAAMIGGLADWFAVTALFRHPLRLPIPHTAIIARKKDQIGAGLAGFVGQYFLTPDVVAERVAAARVPQRLGGWLADERNAQLVCAQVVSALGGLQGVVAGDQLRAAVAGFADKRLREFEVAPLLARLIEAACDSGHHQRALGAMLRATMRFLDENRAVFRRRLAEESPDWVPEWVDDRVFTRGFAAVQSFLADVSSDEQHELRRTYESQLRGYAQRLRTDPEQAARVEEAKLQMLEHPQVHAWLAGLWTSVTAALGGAAADPDSELRQGLASVLCQAGRALRDDPELARRAELLVQRLCRHLIDNYAADLAEVISATVRRWDSAETSRRVELQVGRDLQFIRINGTVVGALAGLAIYGISQLF